MIYPYIQVSVCAITSPATCSAGTELARHPSLLSVASAIKFFRLPDWPAPSGKQLVAENSNRRLNFLQAQTN
ncbi:MAG: hypothetical protein IPN76_15865, partial [Saprospiraceae bacterium]|nr:hypothetical protein [Saprospiraceae bacterium]